MFGLVGVEWSMPLRNPSGDSGKRWKYRPRVQKREFRIGKLIWESSV